MKQLKIFQKNRKLNKEEGEAYFNIYMKHKIDKCRRFHSADKDHREIILYTSKQLRVTLYGEIWQGIINEQIYRPITNSILINRIW